ncbi:septum formation initiator [Streptomyces albus subsp. chlorinus]|uniref:septum site-determining protein Ssd n=1 Tax=Streptomyces albus TaxID=1888 RepID=UPI001570C382|nr:septum site-determining protein Ssd [Streptomyces albus]NSC23097.1 septum formation initiator [Streptomyces albus subsp. chlorinus]
MAENILIVTEDAELLDDLLRLCAAAGTAEPQVAHGGPTCEAGWAAWSGATAWERAPLVLVGDDCAAASGFGDPTGASRSPGASGPPSPSGLPGATVSSGYAVSSGAGAAWSGRAGAGAVPRRPGVLLVGRDWDDPGVWERGVRVGAESVVLLPDAESWLTGRIADAVEGVGPAALTIGVIGGRGGAGASTLACALAVTAALAGERTMLIDADPLGGGLDVLLGAERTDGLRWPDLAQSRGRVGGTALAEALPLAHGLRVLSWDRGDSGPVPAEAMRSVLSAARRHGGVVVVDLPRQVDETVAEALVQLDLGLAVVPAELRAVAAAHRVAGRTQMAVPDLRAVVRTPGGPHGERAYGAGLDDTEVARLLGLPLAGELPWERGLLEGIDRGVPPGLAKDGALARFCGMFWERALSGGGVAA